METYKRRQLQPLWTALSKTLASFIGKTCILAVSGGPDSRALLESFARWKQRSNYHVHVVFVDHGIRKGASREGFFLIKRARSLAFEATVLSGTKESSIKNEADLRELRYSLLFDFSKKIQASLICLAHHAGDSVESFLLHLQGKGGAKNASALESSKFFVSKDVYLVRPFTLLPRVELRNALSALAIDTYYMDRNDQKLRNERSKVRQQISEWKLGHSKIENRILIAAKRNLQRENVLEIFAANIFIRVEQKNGYDLILKEEYRKLFLIEKNLHVLWGYYLFRQLATHVSDSRNVKNSVDSIVSHLLREQHQVSFTFAGCELFIDNFSKIRVFYSK